MPRTTSRITRRTAVTPLASFRPQVTQLEDRVNPADITLSGTTALIDLSVTDEQLSFSTSSAGVITVSSTGGLTLNGNPVSPPLSLSGVTAVSVTDSATGAGVRFNNSSVAYTATFSITLDQSSDTVDFFGASSFDGNNLSATVLRGVRVFGSVTSTSGNISFSANQQATPVGGLFAGIDVQGAIASATGVVSLTGTGADGSGGGMYGVHIHEGDGTIGSVSGGTVLITGTGGASIGFGNFGVYISGTDTSVSSTGNGGVVIDGTGGGSSSGGSGGNIGVVVDFSAEVTAGGTGSLVVTGTGGVGGDGVLVTDGGTLTSGGGAVVVTGTGGNDGGGAGVAVGPSGTISAGGTGAVVVTGTGVSGVETGNNGVIVAGTDSQITSGGGDVLVTGIGDGVTHALSVAFAGSVSSGGSGTLTLAADSLFLDTSATVRAGGGGSGTAVILPNTSGTPVDLGGNDVLFGDTLTLGLTDAELDRVFAGTLVLGSSSAGPLTVTADLTRPAATAVQLVSGGDITVDGGSVSTGGGSLAAAPNTGFLPTHFGTDVTASGVTFSPGTTLDLVIDGTTPDSQFTRLNVAGAVNLSGVTLALSGGYVPVAGDTFTIVSGSVPTGEFTGLPFGTAFTFNGVSLHIFYGSFIGGSDVTLVVNRPPAGVSAGGPYTVAEGSGLTVTAAATDPDGDALTYTWDVNGDGVFGDESLGTSPDGGRTVTFTPAQLAALGLGDGPFTTSALAVRVSDGLTGGTVTASGSLTINNVAPTITGLTVLPTGQFGRPVTASATATDPAGPLDPLTFAWVVIVNGATVATGTGPTFTFTPTASGVYTLTVTVSDGDGGSATASAAVTVPPAFAPVALVVSDAGVVRVFGADGSTRDLVPFPGFLGDLSVASADLNGDALPEVVVGAGAGGGPHVKVFDGATGGELASFFAYASAFTGGVYVAASGDGRIVTGAGAFGGPHVKVFDPTGGELASFFAYAPSFLGGVRVALGDVTGDGLADIVTGAGPGAAPHVKVFAGTTLAEVASFYALAPAFTGGVFVAAAAGRVAAGAGTWGGPQVQVFDAAGRELHSFFAYPPSFIGGVRVAFADLDGDGRTDLVTGPGLGGGLPVQALRLSDLAVVRSFDPFDPLDPLGVFVG